MPTTAIRRVLATLAVAACAAVLPLGASASADPGISPGPVEPKADLVLTIVPDPGTVIIDENSHGERVTQVTLTCGPDGGTHPDPRGACDSLRAVDGHFARLPSVPGPCPAVWAPVTAVATGTWGERTVSYAERFGNACEADVGTDGVFSF
ncbi:protease inhibitorprecursor [Thermobifida halotolerans]|uniref:Protease inhibitorprecursor n=1 Tax=Thermobifida halotolerans TaxID=483545 RepID=A0A399G6G8_9ACTN|nr:SSI family serine proteinase inhibitor [Thermobifida halotolerans]UOE17787.1 protease inhibitorprecursor [Thermobifida halotolerans]